MILTDHVELLTAGTEEDPYSGETTVSWTVGVTSTLLPAHVSYASVSVTNGGMPGRQAMVEELRAVIPPVDFDPIVNRLRWNGTDYTNDGPPMLRRINGRDHHLTVPLRAVNG